MTTPDPAGNYPEPDPPRPADPGPEPTLGEDAAEPGGRSGGTGPARAEAGGAGVPGGDIGVGAGAEAPPGQPARQQASGSRSEWQPPAGAEPPSPWTRGGPAGGQRPITDDGVEWSAPTWSDAETAPAGQVAAGANGAPPPYPPDALHPQPGVPYPQADSLGGPTEGWPPTGRPQPMAGRGNGSRTAVIIGVAAAAVLLLCCVGAVVGALTFGRQVADQVRDRDRPSVGLNQPVRDGDLEFLVTGITCGVQRLGDGFVDQPATGQFCLVDVVVSNVGDQPVAFSDMLQRAYGPSDRRYAADSAAGLLANDEQQVFRNEINPGNDLTAVLVYDIPADDRIVRLVLRESETSPGAEVDAA
jgi:hypothetical protein